MLLKIAIWFIIVLLYFLLYKIRRKAGDNVWNGLEVVPYWKLRLLGTDMVRHCSTEKFYSEYFVSGLKSYQRKWFFNLVLGEFSGKCRAFCQNNTFILSKSICREFLEMREVKENFGHYVAWLSLNPRLWESGELSNYPESFAWNSPIIYENMPIQNLLKYTSTGLVNIELACKHFKFTRYEEFQDFFKRVELWDFFNIVKVDMPLWMSCNQTIKMEWWSRVNREVKGVITENLPNEAVQITSEIFKVGSELWILKDGKYYKDSENVS